VNKTEAARIVWEDIRKKIEASKKLKLYVWEGFCPNYYDGLAFAIAVSEEEAIELIEKKVDPPYSPYDPDLWGEVDVYDIDKKIAFARNGGG
jgi:hypothetical protein